MSTIRGGGVHTLRNPNGSGWVNQIRGVKAVGKSFHLKQDAQAAGRALAMQLGTEHTIHKSNGKVAQTATYGDNSYPAPNAT